MKKNAHAYIERDITMKYKTPSCPDKSRLGRVGGQAVLEGVMMKNKNKYAYHNAEYYVKSVFIAKLQNYFCTNKRCSVYIITITSNNRNKSPLSKGDLEGL